MGIEGKWFAVGDIAELAISGADITADHECGSAGPPALGAVGTHAAAADGVKMLIIEESDHILGFEAVREFYLWPLGFATERDSMIIGVGILVGHGWI